MYSIRSTLILLGIVAVMLLILVSALLFHQKPRTVTPEQESSREASVATTSIKEVSTSTTESTKTVPQKPPSNDTMVGSDFNMEFPTLDE